MSVNQWGSVNQWASLISISITETSQDFDDSISVNLAGSFTAEVTESAIDFDDTCYIKLPVIRLKPKKVIRVTGHQKVLIRVK